MNAVWYYIFTTTDFPADIISRTYTLILDGIGQREILVTRGNLWGITYDDVFLPVELNSKNAFEFEGHAVYIDDDDQVWLGIEVPDED